MVSKQGGGDRKQLLKQDEARCCFSLPVTGATSKKQNKTKKHGNNGGKMWGRGEEVVRGFLLRLTQP